VRDVVGKVGQVPAATQNKRKAKATRHLWSSVTTSDSECDSHSACEAARGAPQAARTLGELLHQAFGFPSFRANQEAVCKP